MVTMKIKRIHIVVYAGLILLSWVIVGLSGMKMRNMEVTEVKAVIANDTSNHFMDRAKLDEILRDVQGRSVEDCELGELKVGEMETALEQNPYIQSAEVWKEFTGAVVVELNLRKPIARVMTDTGSDFYLDKEFFKMEVSPDYTAHVVLIRGRFSEPVVPRDTVTFAGLAELRDLVNYVGEDEFLSSQISEIVLERNGELTIYPEVGDLTIEFGTASDYEDKFERLELFYNQVLNKVGWEKYKRISLEYKGQVVAKKAG